MQELLLGKFWLAIVAGGIAFALVLAVILLLVARRTRRAKGRERALEAEEPVEAQGRAAAAAGVEVSDEERRQGLFARLRQGLSKTRGALTGRIEALFAGRMVDDELFDELEEILITGDVGVKTTESLLQSLQQRAKDEGIEDAEELKGIIREEVRRRLQPKTVAIEPDSKPFVIMMVGVNGVGKTTTIGKIAHQFTQAGKGVILAASDTFRAAAVEQLEKWAERSGSELVRQAEGADPAAVAFDAVSAAVARDVDVVMVDTAGRLHTKKNLMEEMKKIKRVLGKAQEGAPHMVLLVVDANTGQNAVRQAEEFDNAVGIDGIILTKLDGTAKGGVIISVYDQLKIPIYYVGVGEGVSDLRPFDPDEFTSALFES